LNASTSLIFGLSLNPKDIPPDDLDDVILGRMIKEAGMFYRMALERQKGTENGRCFGRETGNMGRA